MPMVGFVRVSSDFSLSSGFFTLSSSCLLGHFLLLLFIFSKSFLYFETNRLYTVTKLSFEFLFV